MKYGADATIADNQGYAPLHLVAQYAHLPLLLYLLSKIPSNLIDPFDSRKCTPLMWACYNNAPLPVLKALLFFGASLTVVDDNGFTAVHWACVRQNIVALRILTNQGANLLTVDVNGKTPKQLWAESAGNSNTFDDIVSQEQQLPIHPKSMVLKVLWKICPDLVRKNATNSARLFMS
jgi:ankyrin repeat protein